MKAKLDELRIKAIRLWRRFHDEFLLKWKPIHLCWLYRKMGWKIPKYFIAGTPILNQDAYAFGADDNATPDNCTFDAQDTPRSSQSTGQSFMIRFRIQESNNTNVGGQTYQLYYDTDNTPSTVTQVTTTDTTVTMTDGLPTDAASLAGTILTGGTGGYVTGAYVESDDSTSTNITKNDFTEFQFCVQFGNDAVANSTYYFFVRGSDAELDNYNSTPYAVAATAAAENAEATPTTSLISATVGSATASTKKSATASPSVASITISSTTPTISISKSSTATAAIESVSISANTATATAQPTFVISASDYITANGEDTTAQLTAPSGKTTGEFTAGRIQDDENPADGVDIAQNYYTEIEWCIKGDAIEDGDVYEFRVTSNGTPIESYTETPQWTVSAEAFENSTATPSTETITLKANTATAETSRSATAATTLAAVSITTQTPATLISVSSTALATLEQVSIEVQTPATNISKSAVATTTLQTISVQVNTATASTDVAESANASANLISVSIQAQTPATTISSSSFATAETIYTTISVNTATTPPHGEWYNQSWENRVLIAVNPDYVDYDGEMPIYVDLSQLPSGFHTNVNQTDARDIRVTTEDGTTEVAREIVFYDSAADTGEIYFLGNVSSTTHSYFYIYYNNASASDYADNATYGAENVWDSNFVFVSHMGDLTSSTIEDSTGTSDGSKVSADNPAESTGSVGDAQTFGGDDYIAIGQILDSTNTLTVSAIVSPSATTELSTILSEAGTAGGYQLDISSTKIRFGIGDGTNETVSTSNTINTSTTYYISGVATGANLLMYLNGSQDNSAGQTKTIPAIGSDLWLGLYDGGQGLYGSETYYSGVLDEVRISNTNRSAAWISTEYNNLSDNATFFFSIGDEESLSSADAIATPAIATIKIEVNAVVASTKVSLSATATASLEQVSIVSYQPTAKTSVNATATTSTSYISATTFSPATVTSASTTATPSLASVRIIARTPSTSTGGNAAVNASTVYVSVSTGASTAKAIESRTASAALAQVSINANSPDTNITISSVAASSTNILRITVSTPVVSSTRNATTSPDISIITIGANAPTVRVAQSRTADCSAAVISIDVGTAVPVISTGGGTITIKILLRSEIDKHMFLSSRVNNRLVKDSLMSKEYLKISSINNKARLPSAIEKRINLESTLKNG